MATYWHQGALYAARDQYEQGRRSAGELQVELILESLDMYFTRGLSALHKK